MVLMNAAISQSFGAELGRIGDKLKISVVWPSPATGLALRILRISGCENMLLLDNVKVAFPSGALDDAPSIATAGYAMSLLEPVPEEWARWQQARQLCR